MCIGLIFLKILQYYNVEIQANLNPTQFNFTFTENVFLSFINWNFWVLHSPKNPSSCWGDHDWMLSMCKHKHVHTPWRTIRNQSWEFGEHPFQFSWDLVKIWAKKNKKNGPFQSISRLNMKYVHKIRKFCLNEPVGESGIHFFYF